jgi:spondin-1
MLPFKTRININQKKTKGSCTGRFKRYFFNYFMRNCEPFLYTGCDGNENNFITYNECMKTCTNLDKNFTAEALKLGNNEKNQNSMMKFPISCIITEWSNWTECSGKRLVTYLTIHLSISAFHKYFF